MGKEAISWELGSLLKCIFPGLQPHCINTPRKVHGMNLFQQLLQVILRLVLFRPPSKNQGICLENLLSPLNLSFVAVSRWGCRRAGF